MKYKLILEFILVICIFLNFTQRIWAEDQLTLADAVKATLENNLQIKLAKEALVEKEAQITQARADALPQLNLDSSYLRQQDPGMLNSSFGQSLLDGSSDTGNGEGFSVESLMPKPQDYYNISLNLTQPIFTFGKIGKAIKAAKLAVEEANLQLWISKEKILEQLVNTYIDALYAKGKIVVIQSAQASALELLRQTENRLEIEDATRMEWLQARADAAKYDPQLIQEENNYRIALMKLNLLMGSNVNKIYELQPLPKQISNPPGDLDSLTDLALEQRKEMQTYALWGDIYGLVAGISAADLKPRIDFTGSYGYSTIKTENLFDQDFESWQVLFTLSFPLFNGLRTQGEVKQAKSQQRQNRFYEEEAYKTVQIEVENAYENLIAQEKIVKSTKMSLEAALEFEKVTQENQRLGMATMLEVLDAERNRITAELSAIFSELEYFKAQVALSKAIGFPLENTLTSGLNPQ